MASEHEALVERLREAVKGATSAARAITSGELDGTSVAAVELCSAVEACFDHGCKVRIPVSLVYHHHHHHLTIVCVVLQKLGKPADARWRFVVTLAQHNAMAFEATIASIRLLRNVRTESGLVRTGGRQPPHVLPRVSPVSPSRCCWCLVAPVPCMGSQGVEPVRPAVQPAGACEAAEDDREVLQQPRCHAVATLCRGGCKGAGRAGESRL